LSIGWPNCLTEDRIGTKESLFIALGRTARSGEYDCVKSVSDYAQKFDRLRDGCPIRATLDVIQGRWKPSILWELNCGTKRFSDLQAALPGITAQVLTVQLRQLEADGVVVRNVYPEVPARVEYALSEHGRALSSAMDHLEAWGVRYLERQGRDRVSTTS